MIVAEPVGVYAVGGEQKPWVLQPARSKDIGLRPDRQFLSSGSADIEGFDLAPASGQDDFADSGVQQEGQRGVEDQVPVGLVSEAIELSVERPMADDEFVPGSRCKAVSANLLRRGVDFQQPPGGGVPGFDVLQPERPAGMRHPGSFLEIDGIQLSRSPAPDGRCPAKEPQPRMPVAKSLSWAFLIGAAVVAATLEAMKGSKPGARKKAVPKSAASVATPRNHRGPISSECRSTSRRMGVRGSLRPNSRRASAVARGNATTSAPSPSFDHFSRA